MRFNKNLALALALMTILSAGVFAQTYYVGSSSFNLPQISVQGNYVSNATQHTYFACLSSLDGSSNAVAMNQGDKCEASAVSFTPTSSNVGNHTYAVAIEYNTRSWNSVNGWQTISNGTDNSQVYNFTVAPIPDDTFSITNWISGLVQSVQNFFCSNFGLFCPAPIQKQTSWCYQESANTSNQTGVDGNCGLNYSGSYSFQDNTSTLIGGTGNLWDGNWSDQSYLDTPLPTSYQGYFYVNYTKPLGALNTSLWQVKDSFDTSLSESGIMNLTIPSDCWNLNPLQLGAKLTSDAGGVDLYWMCKNSTSWHILPTYHQDSSGFYEEAMWWNVNQ